MIAMQIWTSPWWKKNEPRRMKEEEKLRNNLLDVFGTNVYISNIAQETNEITLGYQHLYRPEKGRIACINIDEIAVIPYDQFLKGQFALTNAHRRKIQLFIDKAIQEKKKNA